jgi:guanylate kinase
MSAVSSPRGKLFVIAAPSGAGKTSLVHALLNRVSALRFSISYTTRRQRPKEVDGRDYFFVDEPEFQRMIAADAFLEHAEVFGNRYGTSEDHVRALLAQGHSVLLEIDWQGARQIKQKAPDAISIFILPPSVSELEKRLRGRGTDSDAVIARRLREAVGDMGHWNEFDYAVINDDFPAALDALEAIVVGQGQSHATDSDALQAQIAAIVANPTPGG